jgi:hypothetical protein
MKLRFYFIQILILSISQLNGQYFDIITKDYKFLWSTISKARSQSSFNNQSGTCFALFKENNSFI